MPMAPERKRLGMLMIREGREMLERNGLTVGFTGEQSESGATPG